ncbi:hypothetical protein F4777DRAFT_198875 [Nemania sp. FL0916]|nr:hypothetical protein F4777DRAFT_198875 [Nemania sp. FL0916]
MWDRFRQNDGGVPTLSRKKLEAWQDAHSSSRSKTRGVTGGNSQYQYAVRGGPAPRRPPRDAVSPDQSTLDYTATRKRPTPYGVEAAIGLGLCILAVSFDEKGEGADLRQGKQVLNLEGDGPQKSTTCSSSAWVIQHG